jgi:hypothetical protein
MELLQPKVAPLVHLASKKNRQGERELAGEREREKVGA